MGGGEKKKGGKRGGGTRAPPVFLDAQGPKKSAVVRGKKEVPIPSGGGKEAPSNSFPERRGSTAGPGVKNYLSFPWIREGRATRGRGGRTVMRRKRKEETSPTKKKAK